MELFTLISVAYMDGFMYCEEKQKIFKKYGNSQNKDVVSYTNKIIKEVLK